MTIDEALNVLKQYIDYNNPDVPDFYTMEEACEVVIEALEQEPCNDAISRAKTIDEVSRIMLDHPLDGYEDGQLILKIIQDMPPVTPAEKVGQWIDGKCNKCGTHAPFWAMASTYYCSDYCPDCGSRMMQEVKHDD